MFDLQDNLMYSFSKEEFSILEKMFKKTEKGMRTFFLFVGTEYDRKWRPVPYSSLRVGDVIRVMDISVYESIGKVLEYKHKNTQRITNIYPGKKGEIEIEVEAFNFDAPVLMWSE